MTEEQVDRVTLLPCPLCGGDAWLNDYCAKYDDLPPRSRNPSCRSCGLNLGYLPTPAKAIAAWNTRAATQPSPQEAAQVLPDSVMVWHSSNELDHLGTWSTTRYPEHAKEYVPRVKFDRMREAAQLGLDMAKANDLWNTAETISRAIAGEDKA